jgi:hypothetical protein
MEEKVRELLRSFRFERMGEFLNCATAASQHGFPARGGR